MGLVRAPQRLPSDAQLVLRSQNHVAVFNPVSKQVVLHDNGVHVTDSSQANWICPTCGRPWGDMRDVETAPHYFKLLAEVPVERDNLTDVTNPGETLLRSLNEVHFMEEVEHPNVVHYKHAWVEPSQQSPFTPVVPTLHVLMNAANGGSLADWIEAQSGDTLKAEETHHIATGITKGLAFLHDRGILHLDIKPGNVLLHWHPGDRLPTAMLSDFGSCRLFSDMDRRTGHTGTMEYMAPEAVLPRANGEFMILSEKADVWSLGIVFYMLTFLDIPYANADDVDVLRTEIAAFKTSAVEQRLDTAALDSKLAKLLTQMLSVDPEARPTCHQVLHALVDVPPQHEPPQPPVKREYPWQILLAAALGYMQSAALLARVPPPYHHFALVATLLQTCAAYVLNAC
ncbi:hypothetical protein MCUN1_000425 [Malassezia cuniculi]|uniref:Protein kinase domain-containing protein n=1 Tax=Malassezia cuniculi TaxID=948313 RepID=A0AAF0J4N6_9BASI|nr:hypothetical protein MCUN1_000425 [Malassezia cuniculi]